MERLNMAVWCSKDTKNVNDSDYIIDVHLNFWKLEKNKYFDIGVITPSNAKELHIFLDKENLSEQDIKDLAEALEKEKIRNLIFNEHTPIKNCVDISGCSIAQKKDYSFFFDTRKKNYVIEKKYNGTLITIPLNTQCNQCEKQYTRLRLKGEIIEKFFSQRIEPKSKFEYCTSIFEFLDFRLNNTRGLPEDFLRDFPRFPLLGQVRCFFMIESNEEITRSSEPFKRLRSLEQDSWIDYMEKPIKIAKRRVILAYQWNSNDCEDLSIFIETKTSSLGKIKIALLALLAFVYSVGTSMLASWIYGRLTGS